MRRLPPPWNTTNVVAPSSLDELLEKPYLS
jgi:hypothetical protein